MRHKNNPPTIETKSYPVTNPLTGTVTHVSWKIRDAIIEARRLKDESDNAELWDQNRDLSYKGRKRKFKQYLSYKQFVKENDPVAYAEQFGLDNSINA